MSLRPRQSGLDATTSATSTLPVLCRKGREYRGSFSFWKGVMEGTSLLTLLSHNHTEEQAPLALPTQCIRESAFALLRPEAWKRAGLSFLIFPLYLEVTDPGKASSVLDAAAWVLESRGIPSPLLGPDLQQIPRREGCIDCFIFPCSRTDRKHDKPLKGVLNSGPVVWLCNLCWMREPNESVFKIVVLDLINAYRVEQKKSSFSYKLVFPRPPSLMVCGQEELHSCHRSPCFSMWCFPDLFLRFSEDI